jgi:hypothetical protein
MNVWSQTIMAVGECGLLLILRSPSFAQRGDVMVCCFAESRTRNFDTTVIQKCVRQHVVASIASAKVVVTLSTR